MKPMRHKSGEGYSRRMFLAQTAAWGAASFLGLRTAVAAEPPPEVKKIRLVHAPAICLSPQYLAEELLRLEGFSEIQYVDQPMTKSLGPLEAGQADMTQGAGVDVVAALDAGRAILPLAGIHAGCYELFVNGPIAGIKDLAGKSVAITTDDSTERLFLSSIVAYIGVNPRDMRWITAASAADAVQTFVDGKADAFFAFAPQGEELRAKNVGHVILNTTQDRLWSQYFCCMVSARREFAEKYAAATRRALRAFLKAADLCAQEPEMALAILKDLPYRRWRDADPEDTLRFHALRLHEVGIIKTSPHKLIAQGTDWRFLNGLKKEMKG